MNNLIDDEIRAERVRLVGVEGYGIVTLEEALRLADEAELNLVQLNNDEVPVCKIVDYSKLEYERQKREKKNNKKSELKEIRISPFIADNDLSVKAKSASKILAGGDKLKVSILFKGRSIVNIKDGIPKLEQFNDMVTSKFTIARAPHVEGNRVIEILS